MKNTVQFMSYAPALNAAPHLSYQQDQAGSTKKQCSPTPVDFSPETKSSRRLKMLRQVTDTSRAAYHQLHDEKKLQPMQMKILEALRSGAKTRKQLRDATGMELSSVCGRVNSLLAGGLIELHGEAKDERTGKAQELVGLPRCNGSLFE